MSDEQSGRSDTTNALSLSGGRGAARHGFLERPWIATLISGLLIMASHPPIDAGPLILIAFVPWILALDRFHSYRGAFGAAFLAGLIVYLIDLYWLSRMEAGLEKAGWMYGMWVIVAAIQALYFGVFAALGRWVLKRCGTPRGYPLLAPLWVGIEFWRYYFPAPAPLLFPGYALHDVPALIQIADLGGVHLVTLFVLLLGGLLAAAIRGGESRRSCVVLSAMVGLTLLVGTNLFYGILRLNTVREQLIDGPVVGIVQANIHQDLKNIPDDPTIFVRRWDKHVDLSLEAKRRGAEILFWSETAYPWIMPDDFGRNHKVYDHDSRVLAAELETPLIVGALTKLGPEERVRFPYMSEREAALTKFNTGWYIDRDGAVQGRFDKIHIVPGGEYIPYRGTFLGDLVADYAEALAGYVPALAPGFRDESTFALPRKKAALGGESLGAYEPWRFSLNICYEFAFPQLYRRLHGKENVHFAATLSNEGWYFDAAELDQALIMTKLRAVESRTSFIRATNTGISAVIDPTGAVRRRLTDDHGRDRMIEGVLVAPVPVMERPEPSVFLRMGMVPWWALAVGALALGAFAAGTGVYRRLRTRRRGRKDRERP